jgi:hypothetical protein
MSTMYTRDRPAGSSVMTSTSVRLRGQYDPASLLAALET